MDREESLQEYYFIQERIDALDERALRFKEWNITISSAAIGAAIIQCNEYISLLSILSSMTFWLMEGWWKEKQHVFESRAAIIEEHLRRKSESDLEGPSISASFKSFYDPEVSSEAFYKWRNFCIPIKKQWLPKRLRYISILLLPFMTSTIGIFVFYIIRYCSVSAIPAIGSP